MKFLFIIIVFLWFSCLNKLFFLVSFIFEVEFGYSFEIKIIVLVILIFIRVLNVLLDL